MAGVRARDELRMLKKILLVLIFVFPFVGSVQAADITHMSLDPGTCWLKERGVAVKENPISITGKKLSMVAWHLCPKIHLIGILISVCIVDLNWQVEIKRNITAVHFQKKKIATCSGLI